MNTPPRRAPTRPQTGRGQCWPLHSRWRQTSKQEPRAPTVIVPSLESLALLALHRHAAQHAVAQRALDTLVRDPRNADWQARVFRCDTCHVHHLGTQQHNQHIRRTVSFRRAHYALRRWHNNHVEAVVSLRTE